jgi:hypothetical protein
MADDDDRGSTRRSLLSGLAGAALLGAGGVGGAVPDTSAATELGTFEDGLDGWRAAGGERLSRVGRRDWPPAVTHGEVALCVDPDGATAPAVRRSLDGVDLESAPFVVADATPGVVDGTDAPVAFAFRVRDGLDAAVLAASGPVTVRQAAPGRIYWDASDVGATMLADAAVLEIAWWSEDAADRPYRGDVVLDNVRATPDRTALEAVRFRVAVRHLEADHGSYRRTAVEERDGDRERGRFVFAGGATVPYRARRTADGGCRITLDGDHYRFGGESA